MSLASTLTISVVSHGHGPLLKRLLSDLDALSSLYGVVVIVTLNLSGESLDASRYRNISVRVTRNVRCLGFGANHNQAFKACSTPWFAILNPDLHITDDVFTRLVDVAVARGAALVAPMVVNSEGQLEDSVRHNLTPWSLARRVLGMESAISRPGHFSWYAGMFYVVRASAFEFVSGFDERFFLYCEDYDLCARLHLAALRSHYDADSCVVHDAQRDSRRSWRHTTMHVRSLAKVWLSRPVWHIAFRDAFK